MKTERAGLLVAIGVFSASAAYAQMTPAPTLTPTPQPVQPTELPTGPLTPTPSVAPPVGTPAVLATPSPTPRPRVEEAPPLRITEAATLSVAVLPEENPFGAEVDTAAAVPPKPPLQDATLSAGLFVEFRVDPNGKPLAVRRARDPIPSLAAETQRDLGRWSFEPARRAGQKVETWTPLRLDLQVEVETSKVEQASLTPVTPSSPLPVPFEWVSDENWYQSLQVSDPSDGTVPVSQVDAPASPKRTPFPDSYKGPFSCRFWVRVSSSGRVDRVIPIAASDPVLISYFRRAVPAWTLRPARKGGAATESWNELTLSGQVAYSVEIRQIAQLRKPLAGS